LSQASCLYLATAFPFSSISLSPLWLELELFLIRFANYVEPPSRPLGISVFLLLCLFFGPASVSVLEDDSGEFGLDN